jgi:hypothetical protein
MKHLRVFHSVFQLDPGLAIVRPEKTVFSRQRGAFFERLSTYTYIDRVSVRAGCRCTTYEKEPQVSKVVNQTQVSSSSVLPPTPPVHSSSFHHVCCVVPFIGPKPFLS